MLLLVILMLPMVLMFSVIGGDISSVSDEVPSYSAEYSDNIYSDDSEMYSETGYDPVRQKTTGLARWMNAVKSF